MADARAQLLLVPTTCLMSLGHQIVAGRGWQRSRSNRGEGGPWRARGQKPWSHPKRGKNLRKGHTSTCHNHSKAPGPHWQCPVDWDVGCHRYRPERPQLLLSHPSKPLLATARSWDLKPHSKAPVEEALESSEQPESQKFSALGGVEAQACRSSEWRWTGSGSQAPGPLPWPPAMHKK